MNKVAMLLVAGVVGACSMEATPSPSTRLAKGTLDARVWRTGSDSLYVRSTPSRSGAILSELAADSPVTIGCQTTGDDVFGSAIWDYLPSEGGYVSDYYVFTQHDGFVPGLPRCEDDEVATTGEADEQEAKIVAPDAPPAHEGGDVAPSSSDAMIGAAIAEAKRHLGYTETGANCNQFSRWLGRNECQEWCSDFVNWTWKKAGFDVGGLTGYSGTFADYGRRRGTFKAGMNAQAKPGDAVLWGTSSTDSRHVGMVTAVQADGRITVIHGNFAACNGRGCVSEGTISRGSDVWTGANIYGFVSPAN